jgi:hypothetical protein
MAELAQTSQPRRRGGAKPGERRGGRQKGTPNKTTATMKQAIAAVYEKLQRDHAKAEENQEDHGHFAKWANDNPTEFYRIAAKLLPLQIGGVDNEETGTQKPILVKFVRTEAASVSS